MSALLLLLSACQTHKTKTNLSLTAADSPPVSAELTISEEKTLIDDGDCSQASFSPKGDRLLYVSAKRVAHAQPQIYERNLVNRTERRITFQNGNTTHPHYHPKDNWILYSSSTDELKENPPLLTLQSERLPSKLPIPYSEPAEVYLHSLSGLEIKRVTTRHGYDGEARFSPDGKLLSWTRSVGDRTQVMSLTQSNSTAKILSDLGENPSDYATSPDGKASAWIDWDQSFGVSRLRLRRGKKTVDVAPDMIVNKADLNFTPDSKWLLWAQRDPQTNLYGIWGLELASGCLQHLSFASEGDRREPVVSPDMKRLVYTLMSRGKSRIMEVPFTVKEGACS